MKDKLISQTYDGAATMSGRVKGVQTQIRATYPHAYFVHCYAHQLNLIMKQTCSKHFRTCKVFFVNLIVPFQHSFLCLPNGQLVSRNTTIDAYPEEQPPAITLIVELLIVSMRTRMLSCSSYFLRWLS